MKTITFPFAVLALLSAGFMFPTESDAQSSQRSSTQTKAPHRQAKPDDRLPAAGQPNRQPNRHFPRNYYVNRPLGSANNAPRGYYGDNLSYDPPPRTGHDHHDQHDGPIYVPHPVYYPIPVFYDDGLEHGDVRGPEDAVNPDELGSSSSQPSSQPVIIESADVYVMSPGSAQIDAPGRLAAPAPRLQQRAPRDQSYAAAPLPEPQRQEPVNQEPEPQDPQQVTLRIEPADAVVWLDDEELGLAGELAGQVVLDPGVYLLEVEHYELRDQRLFFGVVDQPVDVRVDLSADEPRRRYRVR